MLCLPIPLPNYRSVPCMVLTLPCRYFWPWCIFSTQPLLKVSNVESLIFVSLVTCNTVLLLGVQVIQFTVAFPLLDEIDLTPWGWALFTVVLTTLIWKGTLFSLLLSEPASLQPTKYLLTVPPGWCHHGPTQAPPWQYITGKVHLFCWGHGGTECWLPSKSPAVKRGDFIRGPYRTSCSLG